MSDKALALRVLSDRLANEWQELADYFQISKTDRAKFDRGREIVEIVEWLAQRERIRELMAALRALERTDLLSIAEMLISDDHPEQEPANQSTLKRTSTVQLNVTAWADLIKKRSRKFPDRLLNGIEFREGDELFASLDAFVDSVLKNGLTVELVREDHDRVELTTDTQQLWIRLLTAVIMGKTKRPLGSWRWFIGETVKRLSDDGDGSNILTAIWDYILHTYCSRGSAEYRSEILRDIVKAALVSTMEISSPAKKSSYLFSFINFLFGKLEGESDSIKEISRQLRAYDDEFGKNESPVFLERLKRLIGIGSSMIFHGPSDIPPFTPKMVDVPVSNLCDYPFEVMIHPLTVLEVSSLKAIPITQAGDNGEYPYVFKAVSDKGVDIFSSFMAEIELVVSLVMESEPSDQFRWDVPTISEWVVASSCAYGTFPWGNEPLTNERANFDFGERPKRSRLRPIGSYPSGASEFGVQDCFGNVHEIVRASQTNTFPQGFRLAGGCYETLARLATPRFIRGFRSKQPETRRNIGLRLVRYLTFDHEKRFASLRAYKETLSAREKHEGQT